MTAAAPKFAPHPVRRAMIAKLHLAMKDLGMTAEDYRAVLERVTGKRSSGDMTDAQLDAALAEFVRLGWKPKPSARWQRSGSDLTVGRASRPADHPTARKARALWLSLWNLGVVRNPSEAALEAFAARQLGVSRLQWANQAHGYKLIEALKSMAERAGWSQSIPEAADDAKLVTILLRRLIERQVAILQEHGDTVSIEAHVNGCLRTPAKVWRWLPDRVMHQISSKLGEQVRAAKGQAGE